MSNHPTLVRLLVILTLILFLSHPSRSKDEPTSSVVFIEIEGPIDEGLAAYVERSIREAREENPDLIVFEINTPGGEVSACLRVAEAIESTKPIPNCSYITHTAWSGGALVALATTAIYMAPTASIGSAEPVTLSPEGTKPVGEKYVSALRAEFRTLAEHNNYPPLLAAAMVDKDIEVILARVDGKKKFLTRTEYEDAKERAKLTGAKIELIETVSEMGKLLNLTARQSVQYGIATKIVEDENALLRACGVPGARIVRKQITWSEGLVRFLTSPLVTSALFIVGLLGLWMEFKMPGFGLPGTVAIVCFSLLFFSKYLTGLASAIDLIIFFLGVALLLVEIFLIPGFGITGIAGVIFIVAGLILSFQRFGLPNPGRPWELEQMLNNLFLIGVGFAVSLVAAFAIVSILGPRLRQAPLFSRLVLTSALSKSAGTEFIQEAASSLQVGTQGVAETDLRPAGKLRVGDDIVDVVTKGEYVRQGAICEVIEKKGPRIYVKEV